MNKSRSGLYHDSVVLFASVISFLFAATGCEPFSSSEGADLGDNDPNLVACCGDSMTAYGYPTDLAALTSKNVLNRGYGGYTSSEGIGVVDNALSAHSPGFVVILFGANDIIMSRDLDAAVENLRAMLIMVKANDSIPVIATQPPMYDSYARFADRVRELNEKIRALASSESVRLADLYAGFEGNRDLILPDGLHPTGSGNALIAQIVARRLR